jgi:hypothetical protein
MAIYAVKAFTIPAEQADDMPAYSVPPATICFPKPDADKTIAFRLPMSFSATVTTFGEGLISIFRTPYRRHREWVKPSAYHFTLRLSRPSTGERLPDLRLYKPRRGFRRILEVRT